jgi:hypothetical protein
MFHRLRRTTPAVVAAALTLALTMAGPPRDAFAFLVIDWGSCRPEIVPDWDEHVLRRTGREICDLIDVGPGIIFRPEPQEPRPDRLCVAKTKKADKALENAAKRLKDKPLCAAELNGPKGTAESVAQAVRTNTQYDACVGKSPTGGKAAEAAANEGVNTDIRFFDEFFGALGGFKYLDQLNDDGLRRQMIVLHELAHATGRAPDDKAEDALNEVILAKCFGIGDKGKPSNASVDANGVGVYPDATTASNDANDGVLGDDGSGDPPTEDVFVADPNGDTVPPDEGGGGCCDGGDDMPLLMN